MDCILLSHQISETIHALKKNIPLYYKTLSPSFILTRLACAPSPSHQDREKDQGEEEIKGASPCPNETPGL